MGFLQRIFGGKKDEPAAAPAAAPADVPTGSAIPAERVGLNGEYDQSGLAKRVAKAFDDDGQIDDVETLWVAQTGGTVVLKGKVPSQAFLDKATSVASGVSGATGVDASQVEIG
jgi:osmotically-inducible protein OsmY